MKKLKSNIVNMAVVLTLISAIAAGALAYVNEKTKGPIEEINARNEQLAQAEVTGGGQGTPIVVSVNGFGGELRVMVGFDDEGNIMGYKILQHSETPGLGAKADTWFQKGGKGCIIGKNPATNKLTVKKDGGGGEVDAITASTITSRAFLRAVQQAYDDYQQQKGSAATDAETGATKI